MNTAAAWPALGPRTPGSAAGPGALERALDAAATPPQARRWIRRSLEGTHRSCWPGLAWRSSRLTGDGYPVELSFAADDPALRWTADVAGPEVDPAQRLPAAIEAITSWDPDTADLLETYAPALHAFQRAGQLRWGCWVGGRSLGEAARWKLYIEIPPQGLPRAGPACALLHAVDRPHDPTTSVRMIGWDPRADRQELYVRVAHLDTLRLSRLLDLAAARHRLGELLDVLQAAYRRPVRPRLPGTDHGLTVSFDRATGTVAAVSVCAFAVAMFGPDAHTRAAVLALAADRGWRLGGYPAVSAPLANTTIFPTAHQMVTITVTADGPIRFHIGLRPPP